MELGFSEVDPSRFPDQRAQNYDMELELLGGISPKEPLPLDHIPNVSTKLHIAPDEVLDFLLRHGFASPPTTDEVLRSRHLDGKPPWFASAEQVPVLHAIKFAAALNVTMGEAYRSLRQLGLEPIRLPPDWLDEYSPRRFLYCFDKPDHPDIGDIINVSRLFSISMTEAGCRAGEIGLDVPAEPAELSQTDLRMISRDIDGVGPWLSRKSPVPPHHFLRAQWKYGMDPEQAAGRLHELGYKPTLCEQKPEDVMLLADLDDGPAIDPRKPVTLARLLLAGRRTSMPISQVAERLRTLGIPVSDVPDMIRAALAKVPRARE